MNLNNLIPLKSNWKCLTSIAVTVAALFQTKFRHRSYYPEEMLIFACMGSVKLFGHWFFQISRQNYVNNPGSHFLTGNRAFNSYTVYSFGISSQKRYSYMGPVSSRDVLIYLVEQINRKYCRSLYEMCGSVMKGQRFLILQKACNKYFRWLKFYSRKCRFDCGRWFFVKVHLSIKFSKNFSPYNILDLPLWQENHNL